MRSASRFESKPPAVLRRVRGPGASADALLGNHDLHLLAVAHGVRPAHASDTLNQILESPERDGWLEWLRARPLALERHGWLCVHAGVSPAWTAFQTLTLAAEVEALLRGPDLAGFLPQMYGNEPARWSDTLQGADDAPPGLVPWFDAPQRANANTPIAFGHWSTLGLVNRPDLLGIDTGCVWGGALTAVRVDGGRREVTQVSCDAAKSPL